MRAWCGFVAWLCFALASPVQATLTLLNEFTAFDASNMGGEVLTAMGNVDNSNPGDEIVVGTGQDGTSFVAIYTQTGTLLGFFGTWSAGANPSGKIPVAIGEINGSSPMEIIVATGSGDPDITNEDGAGWVSVWSNIGALVAAYPAFSPAENPSGEVNIAAGDVSATGANSEVICGTGYGGIGWVVVRNGMTGAFISAFPVWGGDNPNHELPVAAGDFQAGGQQEIAVGHGRGGDSWVAIYSATGTLINAFPTFATASTNPYGRVNVASGQYDGVAGHEVIAGMGGGPLANPALGFVGIFNPLTGANIDFGNAYTVGENPTGQVHPAGVN
jgi:hypothetical protein